MGCTGKDWGRGENSRGEDEGGEKEAPSQSWNQISFNRCGGGRHFMRSRNIEGKAGKEWCMVSSGLRDPEVVQVSQPLLPLD